MIARHAALLILGLALITRSDCEAATIVIQNNDGPGEGLNDPNPPPNANQTGNNPGSNLGELRMNLLNAVAQHWGQMLNSDVTITIGTTFDPLFCSGNSAVLGQAGITGSFANFGAGLPDTAYHVALAESLAGVNLNGGNVEITAVFNSTVDSGNPGCLNGGGFYYGTDGAAPVGTARLFPVALHELAHGLGFGHLADVGSGGSGAFTGSGGFPDAFSRNLFDLETDESWDQMTNGERLASAVNDPDLVWDGAAVTAALSLWLGPAPEVEINAPPGIVGVHEANLGFEPTIVMPPGGVTDDVVDGDSLLGDPCAFGAAPAMSGQIVLFEKPAGCSAAIPAFIAEANNATGVILSSPNPSGLPDMSGEISNQEVTIPYVGVMQSVGDDLRANIATANATIRESDTRLNGENEDRIRMYAPATFELGSSVAHWTGAARPDLLMEPNLGDVAFDQVDLTLAAFADMGWFVNLTGTIFADGFEDLPP